ncbi:EP300-interacting inhibitor of differentiation 3 isoform X2 [Odontomachus brunneus]|nr:EP300-interacting inhibitor of differentiation 3 isoform X2 [Odontomachus brunneus]XP_032668614.1 EP300-interacting inhibitor of differentiation 3 isoform X2 [Odontomachus brunneus]XP_032668615.1 EP300-interacting inhibitor of differentiation 3 isoform X2 [Odontomachus brunneus]XP_032668616.1 EP300-interacting inhibitor of differentiation 3 isoform X2 [Odontomachus brunneus]XP_032668617.1 EP300-interacting inhibitor of differentiation 3 isoform X2 [Odontomachus brunneus]
MPSSRNSSDSSNSNMRSAKERKDCLKRALEQTLILQEAVSGTTINKLDEAIYEVDNVTSETSIHDKVCNQQEVLIDSQMMISSSKVIKTCAISLTKRMRNYDHIDFAQKVVRYLQEMSQDDVQPVNWSFLETRVTKLFKRIPDFSTLGILEPLEKKTVNRQKPLRKIAQQAEMKVPDKIVSQTNTKEDDSVEQTMRKIKKLIVCYCKETQEPLNFFQLIIHPQDFGRTIRNLLYVSFLVKDGVVKLSKDNDGGLVVQPCRKTSQQGGESSNRIGAQTIISLNMKQWAVLKKACKVTKPMIDFDEGN